MRQAGSDLSAGHWAGDVISEGLADLPSSHIRPAGIYIPPTHSPCIAHLDFVQMVPSTWEGLCHHQLWDFHPHGMQTRIISLGSPPSSPHAEALFWPWNCQSTLPVPLLLCWPSLPCGRLGVSGSLTTAICPCRIHPGVGSLNG